MVLREEKKKVRVPPLVVKQSVNGKREWLSNDLQRIKLFLQNGRWTFLWAAAAGNHGRAVTRQWIRTTTKSMSLVTRRHRPREQPTSTFRDAPPVHRPAFIRSLIATRSLCLINPNNPFNVLNIAETKWRKDDVDDDGDVCRARKMEDPSRSRRDDCSRKITIRVCRLSRILTSGFDSLFFLLCNRCFSKVEFWIRLLREIVEFRRNRFDSFCKFCFRKILLFYFFLSRNCNRIELKDVIKLWRIISFRKTKWHSIEWRVVCLIR